ncbi:hypothetical protein F5I97DRAFT_157718 [Phlebopus sp. FC_14]|nr:hypothetical protein F5I97DRAFT_157718 [Phlebopus sp. FC_14]
MTPLLLSQNRCQAAVGRQARNPLLGNRNHAQMCRPLIRFYLTLCTSLFLPVLRPRQRHSLMTPMLPVVGIVRAVQGVFPPPGVVDGPPPSGAQQAHPAYIPMPPGPTVVQMPLFDTLMTILREHRLAQLATVDQQRELMRYMHGLNQWLERDVHDRQAELRSVTARLDQLRADVLGRLGVGAAPGARMQMPEPQHAQPGPFVVPPVPNGAAAGPVPPPQLIGQFPVGFVPQGAALQTPVVPAVARTPSPFTPVIPQAPPGWIGGMPVPGGYPGPVIPPGIPHDGPSSGEQIYFHRPEQHDETVVLGSSPPPSSDGTPAPRPIVVHPPAQPGGTVIIPPSQTGERESRSSTPTQEAWHPPPASPAIPVPAGAYEVPSVIPVPPSVSHHATPPHTTIVNVGPPMGPQVIPVEPQVPPPGQIQSTVPEPVIVQGSGQGGQYGVPMPGMGPQGPLIIQPPVQPPRTVYGPSRSSSRTSERTHGDHVVMVPGSHGHSPPPVVIQAPPGSQGPQSYDDRAIRRSPSIHAYPEGHPSSVAPPVIVNVPTSGSRRRSRSYSPERSHRSRSYSPGEERHPRRLRRRHHDDEYSPDNGGRRGSRSYSPEYRRHRRHEGPYSHEYSEGDRRRHGRERRPRDDYSSEDGRPHRRRDSYSPEDGRRRRHRGDYSPEDGGRRRRRADYSPEDGRRRRHDDHSPEGGGRRRRRDDYSPEDGGRRRRGGDRSPEDGGRTGRRDDYSPGDGSRRRHRGEYSPEDSGRHRHRPGGRSTYSPEDDDRDLDRPRPILSEGRLHHTRPEFIEGDAGSIPAYSQPLPHPVVPPSPLPPTVIRIGGDQPEHDIPRVIISPSSQRPFSPERRPLSPRSQLGHELRHVRPGDTYIPTAPSEAGGRHPSRPPTSMPDAPEPQHPSAGIVMSSSPERSDFHRTPSRGGFPPDVTERPPSDMVHHIPPPPHVPSHPYPGPGDVDFEATLQAQHERMDNELVRFAENADAAESRRDEEFRQNEDARDRIFVENENRRDAEMRQRSDALFQQLEDRVASVPPLPVPPPHDPERASIIESISAAQDAASRHASDIMDTVRMEREDMAREREALAAEREHDHAELAAERRRLDEEREAKIAALEEELARVRGELESERQLRMTEENEARMAAVERDEALRAQLSDLTNVVQQNHTLCEEKKALMDEHWAEKQRWKEERDRQMAELMGMVSRLVEEQAMVRQREEEQRQANEGKPGIEQVLEELQRQNAEQRELLNELSDSEYCIEVEVLS